MWKYSLQSTEKIKENKLLTNGTVVMFKSGSPHMTVINFNNYLDCYTCMWYIRENNTYITHRFKEIDLVVIDYNDAQLLRKMYDALLSVEWDIDIGLIVEAEKRLGIK